MIQYAGNMFISTQTACLDITTQATCFNVTTQATCLDITTQATCFNVTTQATCLDITTQATCFNVTTRAACLDITMQAACFYVTTRASCFNVTTPASCLDITTQATCLLVTTQATCLTSLRRRHAWLSFHRQHICFHYAGNIFTFTTQATCSLSLRRQHVGLKGNEKADRLAKLGSQAPQTQNPVTYRETKTLLHSRCNGDWKKDNGEYQAHLDPIWRLERVQQTTIFRLRTGHCGLSAHLKRTGISDTSLCECGQADQTPDHVLQSCPNMPRDVI